MNKLEEYRDSKAEHYEEVWEEGGARPEIYQGYSDGFDAAIALELPIKFHRWMVGFNYKKIVELRKVKGYEDIELTNENLYQYWIENIYKPE